MAKTSISWTDDSLNIARGCDPVSPGCAHCYAAALAARFSDKGQAYEGLATFKNRKGELKVRTKLAVWTKAPVMLVPDAMLEALSWRKPRMVFVCSMSDLFHEDIPLDYIAAWWAFMAATPHITYQIVTKRASRMREFFEHTAAQRGTGYWVREALALCERMVMQHDDARRHELAQRWREARATLAEAGLPPLTLPNVWLMVSTENQVELDRRVPDRRVPELLRCPAAVHGISAEPLLSALDVSRYLEPRQESEMRPGKGLIALWRPALRLVIVGGESGAGARPNELAWIYELAEQVRQHPATHFFPKQLGSNVVWGPAGRPPGVPASGLRDRKGEDEDEWPLDLRGLRSLPPRSTAAAQPKAPASPQLGLAL